jgi:hypothetical protein
MTAGQLLNRIAEMVDEKLARNNADWAEMVQLRDQRIEELTTALTFQAGVVNGIAMVVGYKIGADDELVDEIKPKPKR